MNNVIFIYLYDYVVPIYEGLINTRVTGRIMTIPENIIKRNNLLIAKESATSNSQISYISSRINIRNSTSIKKIKDSSNFRDITNCDNILKINQKQQ